VGNIAARDFVGAYASARASLPGVVFDLRDGRMLKADA
jgi:hypothetical protein